MRRKSIQILLIIIFAFLIGGGTIFFYPFQLSYSKLEIEVMDIQERNCSFCYPKYFSAYKVVRIIDDPEKSQKRYENWKIFVIFRDGDLKIDYPKKVIDCFPKYNFILEGYFREKLAWKYLSSISNYDGLYFEADRATAILKEACDKKVPKEILF
jgi:hypothetical protein